MPRSLIDLQDVTFSRLQMGEYKTVLSHVSFSIFQNEIKTLIGPNGSGKSTLVKVILDLFKPTSGTIKRKKGLKIGYMPQKLKLNPYLPLSINDFLSLYGVSEKGVLELLKVDKLLNQSLHHLSGGEWQRVLFARALMNKPDLLILDEPTQGVDITGQHDFFKLLLSIKEQMKCSVFLVSHDLHYVLSATDEVICLNKHICCAGKPEDIKYHKEYSKLFGMHPNPYEIAPYQHHHDHCHENECDHKAHE